MEIVLLIGIFLLLLFAGVPVASAMLFTSIINIVWMDLPGIVTAERLLASINSFPLLAVPFFILAGVIMNRGGLTKRLVEVSRAFVGHFHGGTAQVNVLASMFFSGISGSASADASAIGSMLIPTMNREGYHPGFSVGVTASSACIGPIIPPSIVMVVYGSMTNLSIGALFMAGVFPGLAIGFALMGIVAIMSRKYNYPRQEKMPWRQRAVVLGQSTPALVAPLIILGGIVSGLYTATEAGVVGCVYGLFVGLFIYRDLKVSDLKPLLAEAVEMAAIPVFILATASIFGWLLTFHGFGTMVVDVLKGLNLSPTALLLVIMVMFLIIGLFIEGMAAMIIFVPVLIPLIPAFNLNEIHFALIVVITILIGTATPPFGLQLYIAMAISKTSMREVIIWPFIFAMVVVVVAVVLFPPIVTFLPELLLK